MGGSWYPHSGIPMYGATLDDLARWEEEDRKERQDAIDKERAKELQERKQSEERQRRYEEDSLKNRVVPCKGLVNSCKVLLKYPINIDMLEKRNVLNLINGYDEEDEEECYRVSSDARLYDDFCKWYVKSCKVKSLDTYYDVVERLIEEDFLGYLHLFSGMFLSEVKGLSTIEYNGILYYVKRSSKSKYEVAEGVVRLARNLFNRHTSLKEVILPNSLRVIDKSCFNGCISLKRCLIPENVIEIRDRAFAGCSSLESIVLPKSLKCISEDLFNGCSSLKSVVFPEYYEIIGHGAFIRTSIEEIVLPKGIQKVDYEAFYCSGIAKITIPDGIVFIGNNAFYSCGRVSVHTNSEYVRDVFKYVKNVTLEDL